ncbi:dihydrodipicolinate synthase family protein [Falsiroseomonas sp. HW251]|uniref:dihydrodipicolinate synthase family protein n=1 Tax=Falsiroseomonas sp. HW251 TaxID=3390998 RepID=UPI003D312EFF
MTTPFRGCHTVTVTPFTEDGSAIDIAAQKRFLDWQHRSGVPGVILLGTTGEFLTVSDAEREQLIAETVAHCRGRMTVMVGATNAHTPTAVRYAKLAERLGADGLMIAPPYYYTPTEDEIFAYYAAISEAVGIPVMLYNNPFTTHVDMKPHLVARLTKHLPNVRYIKEASMDVGRVFDIVEATEGVMNVFAGERVVESYRLGAVGYVDPYGNYAPRASTALFPLLEAGRVREAIAIQHVLDEITNIIKEGHPLYGHQCYSKALAAAAGYPVGDVRPPITTFRSLGEEGRQRVAVMTKLLQKLDRMMDEYGFAKAA